MKLAKQENCPCPSLPTHPRGSKDFHSRPNPGIPASRIFIRESPTGSLPDLVPILRRNERRRDNTCQTGQRPLKQIRPHSRQFRIRPKLQRTGARSNRMEYREYDGNGRGAVCPAINHPGRWPLLPGNPPATCDCGENSGQRHRQTKIDDVGIHRRDLRSDVEFSRDWSWARLRLWFEAVAVMAADFGIVLWIDWPRHY